MGFVNENITPEEREIFNKRNLSYLGRNVRNPMDQTIDHDLGYRLFYCGSLSEDERDVRVFFIEWRSLYLFIRLHRTSEKIGPHPDYLIIWNDFRILSASKNEFNQKGLLEHLKSALRVFGMTSDPDPYFQLSDGSIIECNF